MGRFLFTVLAPEVSIRSIVQKGRLRGVCISESCSWGNLHVVIVRFYHLEDRR